MNDLRDFGDILADLFLVYQPLMETMAEEERTEFRQDVNRVARRAYLAGIRGDALLAHVHTEFDWEADE